MATGVSFGFVGPSYNYPTVKFDCQRCVNMYVETSEDPNSEEQQALITVPGKAVKWNITPPRGVGTRRMYVLRGSQRLFAVIGSGFYELFDNGLFIQRFQLATVEGRVEIDDNGRQMMIVDGTRTYMFTLEDRLNHPANTMYNPSEGTVEVINPAPPPDTIVQTVDQLPISSSVTFQDGYFLFNEVGTYRMYAWNPDFPILPGFYADSNGNFPFNSTSFGLCDTTADSVTNLASNLQNIFIFGTRSYEVWYNAARPETLFPYDRMSNTTYEIGCIAPRSLATGLNTIYFVGGSPNGYGSIYRTSGSSPVRISTAPIEYYLNSLTDISDAIGYVYHESGHDFYCVTFPTGNKTFCYDLKENCWHERMSLNLFNGHEDRDRAQFGAFFKNENYVGDWQTGKIYHTSLEYFVDDQLPLIRKRVSPHVHSQQNRVAYSRLSFDVLVGTAKTEGPPGSPVQGSDPKAMIRYSDDAGFTWSNELWMTLGKRGHFRQVSNLWKLGISRNRVFEWSCSEPIMTQIYGAYVTVEEVSE